MLSKPNPSVKSVLPLKNCFYPNSKADIVDEGKYVIEAKVDRREQRLWWQQQDGNEQNEI